MKKILLKEQFSLPLQCFSFLGIALLLSFSFEADRTHSHCILRVEKSLEVGYDFPIPEIHDIFNKNFDPLGDPGSSERSGCQEEAREVSIIETGMTEEMTGCN